MHEVAILFSYYERRREVVENNYRCLLRDNPGVPVVPLVLDAPAWLSGTVDVNGLESVWVRKDEIGDAHEKLDDGRWRSWLWSHGDQLFWRYLRSPARVEAERYILFEWDVHSRRVPVREFYAPVWEAELAGGRVLTWPKDWDWCWWDRAAVNFYGGGCVRGVVPFCGLLLSRRAALAAALTSPPPVLRAAFLELYAPTLLHAFHGIEIAEFAPAMRRGFGTYGDPISDDRKPGIFHPVTEVR